MAGAISLDAYHMTRLHIDVVGNATESKSVDYELSLFWRTERNTEDKTKFRVTLGVEASPKRPRGGLQVDAEVKGLFTVPADFSGGEVERHVLVNGASMLYGILRGTIGACKGSFQQTGFLLPTLDMETVVAGAHGTSSRLEAKRPKAGVKKKAAAKRKAVVKKRTPVKKKAAAKTARRKRDR